MSLHRVAALSLVTLAGVAAAAPERAPLRLTLEVDGSDPPARGRYVIERRACGPGSAPAGSHTVPVAAEQSSRTVDLEPGCYDVRFESLDRRGQPVQACDLGAAAGVAVQPRVPTQVIFVGHCDVGEPPLVN